MSKDKTARETECWCDLNSYVQMEGVFVVVVYFSSSNKAFEKSIMS